MRKLLAIRALLAQGWTTAEIADAFDVTPRRVRQYRAELKAQLGEAAVQSRRFQAVRADFLELDEAS